MVNYVIPSTGDYLSQALYKLELSSKEIKTSASYSLAYYNSNNEARVDCQKY